MFDFSRKKQPAFGIVSADDDGDIEVHRMKAVSRKGLWSESIKLTRDVFLVLTVFVLLMVFVAQPVIVEGTSMLPQLRDGERLIVNKLVYYKIQNVSWGHIERGDIVVFWYPKDPEKSFVKRVIGLPGETVEIRNGVVLINGKELREDYLNTQYNQTLDSLSPQKVDEHYYFVMGDNRDNSADSRIWGLVPEKYIYGKVFFRYWLPSNIGFVSKANYKTDDEEIKEKQGSESISTNK